MADLAVYYEHPAWFTPLFRVLDARGVDYVKINIQDHSFDPAVLQAPAPVVLNRLAMSSFLRQDEHAVFYSQAALAHWEAAGARVINGPAAMAIDANKARQLSLFTQLGLAIPASRVVHSQADAARVAKDLRAPLIVKPNIGGSGSGVTRYEDAAEVAMWAADKGLPPAIDNVTLVQEYVPARDGRVIRCETLAGKFLYAIALNGAGTTFDLCPADVCMVDKPSITIEAYTPPPELIAAVEAVAQAAHLDVGGIEYMIDDRDGVARFYDINALSNFVADPLTVLGYDPHEQLVDFIQLQITDRRRQAA
ncbi:MAG: alpha-L-glutamate ligase [Caulobacter sp.]|nr:alpha-L-glutamate ligase [Caulobacter sp.]